MIRQYTSTEGGGEAVTEMVKPEAVTFWGYPVQATPGEVTSGGGGTGKVLSREFTNFCGYCREVKP